MSYSELAERLVATGFIADPWLEGRPRFRAAPEVVTSAELDELYRAGEDVAAVYNEVVRLCAREPALLDDFYGLTPFQKYMWHASQPAWHGIARADVFRTASGLSICEINSDTPTGEAEAVLLGRIASADHPGAHDPNAELLAKYCALLEHVRTHEVGEDAPRTVGLLYPTEMPEDLPLVRILEDALTARGYEVVLGSPYNLGRAASGRPTLFGTECALFIRHYKTDWWGERESIWLDDEDPPDPLALQGPLTALVEGALEGHCAIVNPFAAVVPQNKRSMALMWEALDRFPPWAAQVIRERVPYTVRLESLHPEQLAAERTEWVLKSDYGCEGEEVILGRAVTEEIWRLSLQQAAPGRWVAQRHFEAVPREGGETVNYGVFLIAGRAAGLYIRVERGVTDAFAQSAPALVRS